MYAGGNPCVDDLGEGAAMQQSNPADFPGEAEASSSGLSFFRCLCHVTFSFIGIVMEPFLFWMLVNSLFLPLVLRRCLLLF